MRPLVIKATGGEDAPERCVQALAVAAAAAAAGAEVSLWLTGEATWLAVPGRDLLLPHSPPASELLDTVRALGQVTVCTQCAARRGLSEADLVAGTRVAGAAAFVEEALQESAQALVY